MKKFKLLLTYYFLLVISVWLMGPAIPLLVGLAISAAISVGTSLLINMLTPRQVTERGQITEIQVQGSDYGKSIPRTWGIMRLAGNIIWTAATFTDHVITTGGGTTGGGKGGPKQPEYHDHTYSISFATVICAGPISRVNKIYADTRLIYDSTTDLAIVHAVPFSVPDTTFTCYFGYEDGTDGNPAQNVNATIQADVDGRLGAGSTSANRGLFYIYFNEFILTSYGNRIPSITVEVDQGTNNLATVVSDLYKSGGLITTDLDTSVLATIPISGAALDDNTSTIRDLLEALMNAYNFELPEVAGQIKANLLGTDATLMVPFTDLGSHIQTDQRPVPLERTRLRETDLPQVVNITYIAPSRDYQQNSMPSNVQISQSQQHLDFSLNVALTDDQAKAVAECRLQEAWLGRDTYVFAIPYKYATMAPADKILVEDEDGHVIQMRVTAVAGTVPGALKIQAARHESLIYTQLGVGDSGFVSPRVSGGFAISTGGGGGGGGGTGGGPDDGSGPWKTSGPYRTAKVVPAVPHKAVHALTTGVYAAMNPAGRMLVERVSGSGTYEAFADFPVAATSGTALSALPAVANPGVWDRTNTLIIATDGGAALPSMAESDLIADETQNRLLFETGEYIQFANATLVQDQTLVPRGLGDLVMYKIDTLLRARYGSENSMPLHTANEKVFVADSALQFVEHDETMLGKTLNTKFVPFGQTESSVSAVAVSFDGSSLLPISPTQPVGTRNVGLDLHIAFTRRSRTPSTFRRRTAIPIAEEAENYVVDIIGTTITRQVIFSNLTGTIVGAGGPTLQKFFGASAWDSGAVDSVVFTDTNGALDIMLKVDEPGLPGESDYAIGWTTASTVTSYTDLNYAMVITPIGFPFSNVDIYEFGVSTGHGALTSGGGLAIKISNGVVSYIIDGAVNYSHSIVPSGNYRMGASLHGINSQVQNARADSLVVRSIAITNATSTDYLAAQQTTDFGSTQSSIQMNIYQLSSTNHKGYPLTTTL